MTTRVALVGASGKLGTIIGDVIAHLDGFELGSVLGSASTMDELDGADLVVDASTPASSVEIVRAARRWFSGSPGTRTGLSMTAGAQDFTQAR